MADLFEYQKPMFNLTENGFSVTNREDFKVFLDEVWQKYKEELPQKYFRENSFDEADEDISKKQPFIYFEADKIKPKNYIGFIKYENYSFYLYPKICEYEYTSIKQEYEEKKDKETKQKLTAKRKQINQMLYLWLRYSDNNILPKIEASLDEIPDYDFMDFLIYSFAKYTSDLLSVSVYQHYEEISEETSFLKGKLNFNEYIKNSAMGKAHKFHCTYDSFEMNNKFNQIIKYTAKMLLNITDKDENKNYLNDIIFKLDEVDDVVCSYNDCEKVYINRFMDDFITVLDYCKLFLKNSVTFNDFGEFNNFAFLFRTELLFEDFITNFAKENIEDVVIKDQSIFQLDENDKFHIKPDLIIENGQNKKIIDIKYKDIKDYNNVSNADIYQCITYAVKCSSNDITLLYPVFNKNQKIDSVSIELAEMYKKSVDDGIITLHFGFVNCCPDTDNKKDLEKNIKEQLETIICGEQQ